MKREALAVWSLAHREVRRFYTQRSRVMGAFMTPLMLWAILGAGIGNTFQTPGASEQGYFEYVFAGMVMMVLMFTAIFSMISLIEDRNEGFLQGVLVAPVSRCSIMLGKVMGTTVLCSFQSILMLILAPWAGVELSLGVIVSATAVMILMSFQLGFLGFWMAWRSKTVAGFHVVMNLVLMPMWLMSGALFSGAEAPVWLRGIMNINPMSYGLELMRMSLNAQGYYIFAWATALMATLGFALVFAILAWRDVMKTRRVS